MKKVIKKMRKILDEIDKIEAKEESLREDLFLLQPTPKRHEELRVDYILNKKLLEQVRLKTYLKRN